MIVSEVVTIDFNRLDPSQLDKLLRLITVEGEVAENADSAREAIKKGATGSRLKYATSALEQEGELLRYLAQGNARSAVQHALWMMQCLWRMDVKGVEPEIMRGARVHRGGSKGNVSKKTKAIAKREDWQRQAEALWAKNPRLTKAKVAMHIDADPKRWGTIRQAITKPKN